MKRLHVLLFMGVAGLSSALAQDVKFTPDASGAITFSMPSGNVACIFTPRGGSSVYQSADGTAELSCDRSEPSYIRVIMTERAGVRSETNVGDASCCSLENPLPYGRSWRAAPFTCNSAQTGLTCRRDDGRGFSLSRAGVRTF